MVRKARRVGGDKAQQIGFVGNRKDGGGADVDKG